MAASSGKDKRSPEALKMLAKYPGRLPVICQKAPGWGVGSEAGAFADLPEQKKFLVPSSMSVDGLKDTIQKHIKDTVHTCVSAQTIHLQADDALLNEETMQVVYDEHKADDCFLYISFSVGSLPAEGPLEASAEVPDEDQSPSSKQPTAGGLGKEARKLLARHPNNIPVICEKASGSDVPALRKNKFLVPCSMLCSEFRKIILDNVQDTAAIPPAISVSMSSECLDGATAMQEIYKRGKADDGFLYLTYDFERPAPAAPEVSQPVEDPPAETGATSQHDIDGPGISSSGTVEGPSITSSGTVSIHLPDNDPDMADEMCTAAQADVPLMREVQAPPDHAEDEQARSRLAEARHCSTLRSGSLTTPSPPVAPPQRPAATALDEVSRMITKFPGRVPVFCKRGRSDVPEIARSKFLVPGTMLVSEFKYMIHRQLTELRHGGEIGFTETIYLFLDNVSPKTGATMGELYSRYKKDDNYLHVTYSLENTLGCMSGAGPTSPLCSS